MRNSASWAAGLCVAAVVVVGCIPAPVYTHTAEATYPAKPRGCAFKMQSTDPPEQFIEIGTINGCQGTVDMAEYRALISDDVCAAGGDLVVGTVNGNGVFCQGVVFRRR